MLCLNLVESTAVSVSLFAFFAVIFLVCIVIKKIRQSLIIPTVLLGIIIGCLLFSVFQYDYDKTVSLTGENLSVSGVIAERPEFSSENCRYYCVIKADKVGKNNVKCKLRFSFSETYDEIDPYEMQIGDKVDFIGTVYKAGRVSETSRNNYKSHGVYLGAYAVEDFKISKPSHRPVGYYIDLMRHKVASNLTHDFDNKNASLLVAILTGDKSYMDDELYSDFIEAGIVHIMAVSGLHLSIWVSFFSFFIEFKGKKGKILAVLMIFFTVFMMNFACFTGSVKRASAMTILYFIGKIFGKKTDALNSLGFAAVCGLAFNPFGVLDISFLLSFLSTMGIILMGVPLSEKIISKITSAGEKGKRLLSPLIVTFSFSVSVAFFVFPVSVIVLGGVSLVSPLSNLLCFFAVSPLLLLTGFYSFLRFVPLISPVMAVIIKYLSEYIIRVEELTSKLPFSYINTYFEKLWLWFLVAFIFLLTAMLLYNYSRILMRVTAIISAGIFLLSFSVNFYTSLDKCKIMLYGESKGSCAVVSLNGKGVLIGFEGDRYDEKEIVKDIEREKIKIEAAIFTEEFVSKDMQSVCSLLEIKNILTHDGENVVLFDKVRILKDGKNINVDSSEINTEIFLQEYLQDEQKYDTMSLNDGKFVFSFRERNPYTVTVTVSGGEIYG
ncbi:MAG: ComEC/Rec2 family competence protein [Clostridia bacterium]|nr:ComEC/Rec2 family competence protein [Clostridia bacterium]